MAEKKSNDQADAPPAAPKKLHIAVFPWLAFGHMMPFLHLSKLIAQKGHKISFLSTPLNIDRLCTSLISSSSDDDQDEISMIEFVKLPFHSHPNLPQNAQSTADVTYKQVHYLYESFDLLQPEISLFLHNSKPDWIIQDFSAHWLHPITLNLGIRCAYFSNFKASSLLNIAPFEEHRNKPEDYTTPPNWIPFPSNQAYRLHEVVRIFDNMEPDNTGVSPYDRIKEVLRNSDTVLVRSCYDLEYKWFNLLQTLYKKPVFPVGILPADVTAIDNDDSDETWKGIKTWLDKQTKGSVVYVAFGSETKVSQSEITELALGLEMSELPFFWALKTRRGSADDEPIQLPTGFESRVGDRCMIYTSWVPQLKILRHESVCGLLFHSGWSTVIEAIQFGKSMVVLPFQSDQPLVARFLEEEQLGYCLPRDERDGSFTREDVAAAVRLVMVEEGGRVYRDKVLETQSLLFGDANKQDMYVENILHNFLN